MGRAAFHGAADFFTLGLWEVVGTPTEMLLKEDESTFTVVYDKGERAAYITAAGGELGHLQMGEKPTAEKAADAAAAQAADAASGRSAEARLTALKQLYDEGQITKQEYEQRRSEIVRDL